MPPFGRGMVRSRISYGRRALNRLHPSQSDFGLRDAFGLGRGSSAVVIRTRSTRPVAVVPAIGIDQQAWLRTTIRCGLVDVSANARPPTVGLMKSWPSRHPEHLAVAVEAILPEHGFGGDVDIPDSWSTMKVKVFLPVAMGQSCPIRVTVSRCSSARVVKSAKAVAEAMRGMGTRFGTHNAAVLVCRRRGVRRSRETPSRAAFHRSDRGWRRSTRSLQLAPADPWAGQRGADRPQHDRVHELSVRESLHE